MTEALSIDLLKVTRISFSPFAASVTAGTVASTFTVKFAEVETILFPAKSSMLMSSTTCVFPASSESPETEIVVVSPLVKFAVT